MIHSRNIYISARKIQNKINRTLLFFALMAFVFKVSAQDLAMLSDNPQWKYARYRGNIFEGAEPNAVINDKDNGLQEIGGKKYHILYQVEKLYTDNGEVFFSLVEPLRVREENGKVYVLYDDFKKQIARLSEYNLNVVPIPYQQTSENEFLIYDFTLQTGDRYPTSSDYENIYVEKVESFLTDDSQFRKLLTLSNGLQILEGIGCLNSRNGNLLYYLYPPMAWKYNNDIYHNRLYECRKNKEVIYKEYVLPSDVNSILSYKNISKLVYFDLFGRRLEKKPTKGIYIQNGKKYIK